MGRRAAARPRRDREGAVPGSVLVQSLQERRRSSTVIATRTTRSSNGDSLLALTVNGVDLSLDHGYPARIIVPDNPGVHNTKWVSRMTFEA